MKLKESTNFGAEIHLTTKTMRKKIINSLQSSLCLHQINKWTQPLVFSTQALNHKASSFLPEGAIGGKIFSRWIKNCMKRMMRIMEISENTIENIFFKSRTANQEIFFLEIKAIIKQIQKVENNIDSLIH